MENVPPPAEELAILDRELVQIEARRAQLLARRAWLLSVLRAPAPQPFAPRPFGPPRTAARESAPPNVQNVLLTLGAVLLTIAAIAFTVVSWGHLGIGGRAAVLGAVTVATLSAPVALLRRGLTSTAESVAALGLALMVLDAYALHRVALPDTDGVGYAAVVSTGLALLWSAYGMALGRLRLPLPVAVVTAQLPLVLWAVAAGAGPLLLTWAVLATATLDTAIALWGKGAPVRAIACAGAWVAGAWAVLGAGWMSVDAGTTADAVAPGLLLLAAAALALFAAWRAPSAEAPRKELSTGAAAVAGLAAVAAVGGVLRTDLADAWTVLAYLLPAVALPAVVRTSLPSPVRLGLAGASGAVHAAALLWAVPAVALAVLGPAEQVDPVWSGAPGDAREALGTEAAWAGMTAAPVVLLIVAGVLTAVHRAAPAERTWRPATACGALVLVWAAAFALPPALELPYAAGAAIQLLLTAAALAAAIRLSASPAPTARATPAAQQPAAPARPGVPPTAPPKPAGPPHGGVPAGAGAQAHVPGGAAAPEGPARAWSAAVPPAGGHAAAGGGASWLRGSGGVVALGALGCALVGAISVSLLSLAARPATFAVLGALFVLFTGAAAVSVQRLTQAVCACAAVAFATGLVAAVAAALDFAPHHVGLAVLTIPAAAALLAHGLGEHPARQPVEITGGIAALLAVRLAVEDAPTLALVLALCGVICAGTALRADRRPAGYAAAVLFVLATWVRLAASEVVTPEAYTLPVTVPALVIGWLRRRRDPEASSWTAYGPGLAATLLPSLIAAWGDSHWLRPLLLGVAALAVTLAGARLRLQALLVLGGAALALVALHELAPYVVQVVGALPRWLPPALAGLLLLGVGATYEQRLRDARRLRDSLGRMR
ncbi:SCO7613 C-terminal domain-containing membrane protein [Streptomyces sp. SYSU K21746]